MKNLTLKIGNHSVLVNGKLNPKYSESKGKKEFRKKIINIEIILRTESRTKNGKSSKWEKERTESWKGRIENWTEKSKAEWFWQKRN